MATIRVRRSGLVAFSVRMGSAITGLIFILLVTNNVSPDDFGLWGLILRVISYITFVASIISFWTIRYRARGTNVGRTAFLGGLLFSGILSAIYIPVAVEVASTSTSDYNYAIFFFLLSTPQIFLAIMTGTIESVLLGYFPEKASAGFMIFEVSKIIIGVVAVPILHLSLEGTILAVTGAQACQLVSILYLSRGEYRDSFSFPLLSKMIKTGWLAVLSNISPLIYSFDFLVISFFTKSLLLLAYYSAALTIASIVGYSSWLTTGLYANILSGKDAKVNTSRIFNLQLVFAVPMALGAIILSYRLLNAFRAVYSPAWPIVIVLAIVNTFSSITYTPETVISGTDLTDASDRTDFSIYSRSRLFLLSKINIILASCYVVAITIVTFLFAPSLIAGSGYFLGYRISGLILFGVVWSATNLAFIAAGFVIKGSISRHILPFLFDRAIIVHISIAAIAYSIALALISKSLPITGGVLDQATEILLIGLVSLGVYAALIFSLNKEMRELTKRALTTLIRS